LSIYKNGGTAVNDERIKEWFYNNDEELIELK